MRYEVTMDAIAATIFTAKTHRYAVPVVVLRSSRVVREPG